MRVGALRWARLCAAATLLWSVTLVLGGVEAGTASAAPAVVPGAPSGVSAVPGVGRARLSWSAPSDDGGAAVDGYQITALPSGQQWTVPIPVTSWWVDALQPQVGVSFTVAAHNPVGVGADSASSATVSPASPGGLFRSLAPARLLDTRDPSDALHGKVPAGSTIDLPVAGRGGVPTVGAAAVVLNLTVVDATTPTYVTAWPSGASRPLASNLNVDSSRAVANMVEVKVGASGKVSLYNNTGSVDLVADVEGWVAASSAAPTAEGAYHPLVPARVLDTRNGTGAPEAPAGAGGTVTLALEGRGGVPASGVSAVVLNVTATDVSQVTDVRVWPTGDPTPVVSNLNLVPGETRANRVTVKLGVNGSATLRNNSGTLDLVADVAGWYTDGSGPIAPGAEFNPINPSRVLDTRDGTGTSGPGKLAAGATLTLNVAGVAGLPAATDSLPATAIIANVTAVDASSPSFLTVWPDGTDRPLASDVNFAPGGAVPNLVVAKVGGDGKVSIYNNSGSTDVVVDVLGWYAGDMELGSNLKALTGPAAQAVTATTPSSVTFSTLPAGLTVGDILLLDTSAAAPFGFYGRVASINGQTVNTVDVGINDIVPITSGDDQESSPADAAGQTAAASRPWTFDFSPGAASDLSGTLNTSFVPQFTHNFTWGHTTFNLSYAVSTSVSASVSLAPSLNLDGTKNLAQKQTIARFPLGIPLLMLYVQVQPQAKVHLGLPINAVGGTLSASATASGTVGVSYDGSLHTYSSFTGSTTASTAGAGFGADGSFDVGIDVSLVISGIPAGPDAFIGPELKLEASTCAVTASVRLIAQIAFTINFDLGPYGKLKTSLPITDGGITIKSWELAVGPFAPNTVCATATGNGGVDVTWLPCPTCNVYPNGENDYAWMIYRNGVSQLDFADTIDVTYDLPEPDGLIHAPYFASPPPFPQVGDHFYVVWGILHPGESVTPALWTVTSNTVVIK